MSTITSLYARQILDSRGYPTLEVIAKAGQYIGIAKVPSGASTGSHEALELRDNDPAQYAGKSVHTAVNNVNTTINTGLQGKDPCDQQAIDALLQKLDGTENKSHLGANAMIGVSMAMMHLGAAIKGVPLYAHIAELFSQHIGEPTHLSLPTPLMNVINGGKHADSGLAVQECMIVPIAATSFAHALQIGAEVFHSLKKILAQKGLSTGVGDEGGFAPKVATTAEALTLIMEAAKASGHESHIALALDVAASEQYSDGLYHIDGLHLTASQLTEHYQQLQQQFPIVSIEDSHSEDDFPGFTEITTKMGDTLQLVGDDLFVTNTRRLQLGIDQHMANSILIKLNQIGTVTETLATIALAKKHNMNYIISHRSGETEDTTIADVAVGTGASQIKTGSLSRSERIAKYNRLLAIEEELGEKAEITHPFKTSQK